MRNDYIIYPAAKRKLERHGLIKRIEKALPKFETSLMGVVYEDEVISAVDELKEKGFTKTLQKDEGKAFAKKLNILFKNRDKSFWTVKKPHGTLKQEIEIEDFMILTGWTASNVLKPNELWNYKKFGFKSISEVTGTVGAAIMEMMRKGSTLREGYNWRTKLDDGRVFINEISGDHNFDMRIYQTDITPYETADPMGNTIHYRPQFRDDNGCIAAYHSTESAMLITVLKYAEQTKKRSSTKPKTLEDKAQSTIRWAKSFGQHGGGCAEHYGGFDRDAKLLFFPWWDCPLPVLNENNETNKQTHNCIPTAYGGDYGAYMSQRGELLFSHENFSKPSTKKGISAFYQPDEIDHLIKGLLYQSAMGLGRTSVRQLISILEYRFSEDFEKYAKPYRSGARL